MEDLKRKDFIGHAKVTRKALLAADFPEAYAAMCRDAAPLNRFLCGALGLEY